MGQPAPQQDGEALPEVDWDASADEAIAACDGDLTATIKSLLVMLDMKDKELDLMRANMSRGYARGLFHLETDDGLSRP